MNSIERIKRLLEKKDLDRPLVSLWKHFPVIDTIPEKLVEKTVSFQEEYSWDFVKICHHGLYSVEDYGVTIQWPQNEMERGEVVDFAIKEEKDWDKLQVLSPFQGALGRELNATKEIKERIQTAPVLATVFSPLTTGIKMTGEVIFEHIEKNSLSLLTGLEIIMETTIAFVKELAKVGVDGIFFASQLTTHDRMQVDTYRKYGEAFDLPILESIKDKTWFNIFHLHGQEPMIQEFKNYPVQGFNWHDRITKMTIEKVAFITDKVLIGGIDENTVLMDEGEEGLKDHVLDALKQAGGTSLILGPGCVVPLEVKDSQFSLLKKAVSSISL